MEVLTTARKLIDDKERESREREVGHAKGGSGPGEQGYRVFKTRLFA